MSPEMYSTSIRGTATGSAAAISRLFVLSSTTFSPLSSSMDDEFLPNPPSKHGHRRSPPHRFPPPHRALASSLGQRKRVWPVGGVRVALTL